MRKTRNEVNNGDAAENFLKGTGEIVLVPPVSTMPEDPISTMSEAEIFAAIHQKNEEHLSLEAQLDQVRAELVRLNLRLRQITNETLVSVGIMPPEAPVKDLRTVCNPEKNLKISAIRGYSWAKSHHCTAEVARDKALKATMKSAKKRYHDDPTVKPFLAENTLPPSVLEYIEKCYQNYASIKIDEVVAAADNEDLQETQEIQEVPAGSWLGTDQKEVMTNVG